MKTILIAVFAIVMMASCAPATQPQRSQITLNQEPTYTKTEKPQEPATETPVVATESEEDKEKQKNFGVVIMMGMVTCAMFFGFL